MVDAYDVVWSIACTHSTEIAMTDFVFFGAMSRCNFVFELFMERSEEITEIQVDFVSSLCNHHVFTFKVFPL